MKAVSLCLNTGMLLLFAAVAAGTSACNANNDQGSKSGAGKGDASADSQNPPGNDGGLIVLDGSTGDGSACPVHCSADLHQVLDCNNSVVTTCSNTQGCGTNGACVDSCAAAVANKSTIGCDFFSLPPSPETETTASCFAALIANTWTTPVTIQVAYNGQTLDVSSMARVPTGSGTSITYQPLTNGQLQPGEVGILFLSQSDNSAVYHVACPSGVTTGISTDPAVLATSMVNAFHITTNAPIVAYDIYPYGGAASYVSSATLLVPTSAWGTNYIAADGFQEDPDIVSAGGLPYVQIVAAQDNTTVTISPTAAIVGGTGVAATGQGQPQTYVLNQGQGVQFWQDNELAGSPISSDKPISVWGGSGCMRIPIGVAACDSGHQQLLPVNDLGYQYAAVRFRSRATDGTEEWVPWTIIGAVDGTTLTYDPAPPGGSPLTLDSGQMVRFNANMPFTVTSQDDSHPFYFAGHMTGGDTYNGAGDPEFVNVVPPEQFLAQYLFLTDPTYSNTNLVFVRQQAPDGTFKDVTLDCVGTLGGWQPVDSGDLFEYTRVDLVINSGAQGNCNNGVHLAQSDEPFGLTVWGWDSYVSYAYPAGMSTQPINSVVVPPAPK